MDGPFPCPNTPSQCDTNPNPLTPFSSEAEDSTTFIGLAWQNQLPALNKPFNVVPCEAITESQASQSDADIQAANQVVICANPCAPTFSNSAQTASGTCPNGSTYSLTIPAGIFTADNQVLADRRAFTAAVAALRGHSICLGSLAPASVCRGEFYFGSISLVTTDAPATILLLSGDVPDGLVLIFESDRAVVQGTPLSFGTAFFTLQAASAAGVLTQQTYAVVVTGIVTDATLPEGTVGDPYSAQLTAIIPDGSIAAWSVTAGDIPDGLSLNADTGEISGTPTTVSTGDFTIAVTAGGQTCAKEFSLAVSSSAVFVFLPEPSSDASAVLPDLSDPPIAGVFDGSSFLLMTQSGRTFTSVDGLHWTDLNGNANTLGPQYYGLVFGGGLFIALLVPFTGPFGSFAVSSDGINWSIVTPVGGVQGPAWLQCGIFFQGQLHISDDNGEIFTSSDWTSNDGTLYSATSAVNFGDVISMADNGSDISVGVGIGGIIFFSSDAENWTLVSNLPGFNDLPCVAFGNGIFVAVGLGSQRPPNGVIVTTSVDGQNWSVPVIIITDDLLSICFGNGLFVVVSATGAWSSPDGQTWTPLTFTLPGSTAFTKAFFMDAFTFIGLEQSE